MKTSIHQRRREHQDAKRPGNEGRTLGSEVESGVLIGSLSGTSVDTDAAASRLTYRQEWFAVNRCRDGGHQLEGEFALQYTIRQG